MRVPRLSRGVSYDGVNGRADFWDSDIPSTLDERFDRNWRPAKFKRIHVQPASLFDTIERTQ